jgi:hypothetical protein
MKSSPVRSVPLVTYIGLELHYHRENRDAAVLQPLGFTGNVLISSMELDPQRKSLLRST